MIKSTVGKGLQGRAKILVFFLCDELKFGKLTTIPGLYLALIR